MNKRGALDLALSTIVMIVVAIVFLAAAIPFIQNIFSTDVLPEPNFPQLNPATSDNPVTISRSDITTTKEDETFIGVSVYNTASDGEVTLNMNCNTANPPTMRYLEQNIAVGEEGRFTVGILPEESTSTGNHICGVEAQRGSETLGSSQFTVRVEI